MQRGTSQGHDLKQEKENSREKILNNDRMAERTKKNKTNPKTYEQKRLLSHSLNF